MSEDNSENLKKIAEVAEQERLRLDVSKRKLLLDDQRTKSALDTIRRNQHELEIARSLNFGELSPDMVARLQEANDEYIEAAKNSMTFMNDEFKGIIPYFQKNIIFIGGKTGEGKSTTVANIAFSTIKQRNPTTGKPRRVLVLTNEEKSEDVYNRVTCLMNGWSYTNHDQFTTEQTDMFRKMIPLLAKDGLLTVIDNEYGGAYGLTTSIEGICNVFDNLIRDEIYYDVVLIDYYQNVKHSKEDTSMTEFEVQARLAAALDNYKNIYPAPIVLMSQVNPPDEGDKTPFQYRIKGRKIIMDVATCAVEMVADRENYRTQWKIHKSRFNESIGKGFFTGFDRGRYVQYDNNFIAQVAALKERRMLAKAGIKMGSEEDIKAGLALKEKMEK